MFQQKTGGGGGVIGIEGSANVRRRIRPTVRFFAGVYSWQTASLQLPTASNIHTSCCTLGDVSKFGYSLQMMPCSRASIPHSVVWQLFLRVHSQHVRIRRALPDTNTLVSPPLYCTVVQARNYHTRGVKTTMPQNHCTQSYVYTQLNGCTGPPYFVQHATRHP